jgi:hypothetical protein
VPFLIAFAGCAARAPAALLVQALLPQSSFRREAAFLWRATSVRPPVPVAAGS